MKNILLVVIILLYFNAQSQSLKVFYLKGDASFQNNVSSSWLDLELNSVLYDGFKVNVGKNAILILINEKGLSYTLNPGISDVSSILKSLENHNTNTNIFSRYLSFIWKKLQEDHKDLDKYSKKYMREKGIVVKNGCTQAIMIKPYFGTSINSDSIEFAWVKEPKVKTFTLEIYNSESNGNVIYSIDLDSNRFKLNTKASYFKTSFTYYWSVFPKSEINCTRFPFKIEKRDSVEELKKKLSELQTQLQYGDAFNAFIKAEFYEQNNYLIEARQHYETAIRLEPNNPNFNESFTLFLARNNIKK